MLEQKKKLPLPEKFAILLARPETEAYLRMENGRLYRLGSLTREGERGLALALEEEHTPLGRALVEALWFTKPAALQNHSGRGVGVPLPYRRFVLCEKTVGDTKIRREPGHGFRLGVVCDRRCGSRRLDKCGGASGARVCGMAFGPFGASEIRSVRNTKTNVRNMCNLSETQKNSN